MAYIGIDIGGTKCAVVKGYLSGITDMLTENFGITAYLCNDANAASLADFEILPAAFTVAIEGGKE